MKLSVKVLPSSSRDYLAGWLGGTLKIKVRAHAEKGKANKAVISVLGKVLGLSGGSIRVVSGATSQLKILEIDTMKESEVIEKLSS